MAECLNHNSSDCWICSNCKLHNFICNEACYCGKSRGFEISRLQYYQHFRRVFGVYLNMPAKDRGEELFKQFFNHEATLVASMSFEDLEKHIEELEDIAYEARVRLQASSGARKNRIASLSEEERDKLISRPDFTASEKSKLELPKRDKKTKADKLKETLLSLGHSDEEVAAMMANVKIAERPPSQPTTSDRILVDKRKDTFKQESSNNTQEVLLNEYLNNTIPEDWKIACMNLPALGINGSMLESIKANSDAASDRIYERYRTIGHIAWKTKVMLVHKADYMKENVESAPAEISETMGKTLESLSEPIAKPNPSVDWDPFA